MSGFLSSLHNGIHQEAVFLERSELHLHFNKLRNRLLDFDESSVMRKLQTGLVQVLAAILNLVTMVNSAGSVKLLQYGFMIEVSHAETTNEVLSATKA